MARAADNPAGPTTEQLRRRVLAQLEAEEAEQARQAFAAMPAEQRAELERVSDIARRHHEHE